MQGLMKTAQNWPQWKSSSVLWRKRLSASSITTRSYCTSFHAYSLFSVSLNLQSNSDCLLYGFLMFSTLTTLAPSSSCLHVKILSYQVPFSCHDSLSFDKKNKFEDYVMYYSIRMQSKVEKLECSSRLVQTYCHIGSPINQNCRKIEKKIIYGVKICTMSIFSDNWTLFSWGHLRILQLDICQPYHNHEFKWCTYKLIVLNNFKYI